MDLHVANEATRLDMYLNSVGSLGEWPKSIIVARDAYVLPQTRYGIDPEMPSVGGGQRRMTNGGVYACDGVIVPSAIHRGGPYRYVPDHWEGPPPEAKRLSGRWLFGGALRDHFGHFVLESLGRLWGVEDQPDLSGIVYVAYRPSARPGVLSRKSMARSADKMLERTYIRDLIQIFCGDLPIKAVTAPTQVEELVVPSQLIGNTPSGDLAAGHPAFRDFVHRALRRFDPPAGAPRRRLYISRSQLPADCVAFLFEDQFERALAEEGYEVIYPERMKIEEQIAAYAGAGEIVTPTGSAIHLAAFAMNGGQRVAVIDRSGGTARKFVRQLDLFGAREVVTIGRPHSAISRSEERPERLRKSKPQAHLLDLDAVWADLLAAGFVSQPRRFGLLAPDKVSGAVAALSTRLGAELVVKSGRDAASEVEASSDLEVDGEAEKAAAAPTDEEKRARRKERRRKRIEARDASTKDEDVPEAG